MGRDTSSASEPFSNCDVIVASRPIFAWQKRSVPKRAAGCFISNGYEVRLALNRLM